MRMRSSGFNWRGGLTSCSEAAAAEARRKASNLSQAWPLRFGEPDVDRANAEDGDYDGLFDSVRYAVIMEGPRLSLDITARRHRHSQFRRKVGATVDPPRSRHDHLDTIGGIAVRRAEPAGVPFHQDKIGTRSVEIAIELR